MSGVPLAGVEGQAVWSVLRLRPNLRAVAQDSFDRLISGTEHSVEFQAQWLRKDGRATPPSSERILLVEDEPTVRDLCKRALEAEGYRVSVAGPRDALDMSAQLGDDLDLLVTDVVMPDFDGPTIAAALTSSRRDLRVLFMSGYPHDREEELTGAIAEGAVLAKPFTPRELCGAVRRALDRPPRVEVVVAGRIEKGSEAPSN